MRASTSNGRPTFDDANRTAREQESYGAVSGSLRIDPAEDRPV